MAIGNWVADILLHAYAEMLEETSKMDEEDHAAQDFDGRADAVIICGGTMRGDSVYPPGTSSLVNALSRADDTLARFPGKITLGDLLEIMPFDDPVVCLEVCTPCSSRCA